MSGTRRLDNWLKSYLEYVKESESPDTFHLWTGLSVLASTVRRNIWLNQNLYLLYPHMFVMLVGPPGKVAKSTTIRLGRRLLLGLDDIEFGPDSITQEELVRIMAKSGDKSKVSALTIHSTELSSLIDPSGVKMIQFLTDIYDGDYKWRRSTKGSGRDIIHNPSLNILAGTTPTWLAEGLPVAAVDSGFTARIIFIYEEDPRFDNPFPGETDKELVNQLIEDLKHIATLKGEFDYTPEAREVYKKHYKIVAHSRPSDYRIEGFHWRKAKVHLLKTAMLLSIAEKDDLIITAKNIEVAWTLLNQLEKKMAKTFSAVGKYEYATDLERMLDAVNQSGGITAQQLYNENRAVGDVDTISKMILMLVTMGKIKRTKKDGQTWLMPTTNSKELGDAGAKTSLDD